MNNELDSFNSLFASVFNIFPVLFFLISAYFVYIFYVFFILDEYERRDTGFRIKRIITIIIVMSFISIVGTSTFDVNMEDIKEKYTPSDKTKILEKYVDIKKEHNIDKVQEKIIITEKDVNLENRGNLNMTVINGPVILSTSDNKIRKCKSEGDEFHCE